MMNAHVTLEMRATLDETASEDLVDLSRWLELETAV